MKEIGYITWGYDQFVSLVAPFLLAVALHTVFALAITTMARLGARGTEVPALYVQKLSVAKFFSFFMLVVFTVAIFCDKAIFGQDLFLTGSIKRNADNIAALIGDHLRWAKS